MALIVKRFVELMEGTIEAISTEGVGTEFIIKTDFLLVSRALLETTNRPSTVSVKQQIMEKRILLVEDNELNREIAATLLQDVGFEVTEAGDGAQAVELIKHAAPDTYAAILMDIQMPVMDATPPPARSVNWKIRHWQTYQSLRFPQTPLKKTKVASRAAGMNGHLAKPMNTEAVLAMMEEVLGRKES